MPMYKVSHNVVIPSDSVLPHRASFFVCDPESRPTVQQPLVWAPQEGPLVPPCQHQTPNKAPRKWWNLLLKLPSIAGYRGPHYMTSSSLNEDDGFSLSSLSFEAFRAWKLLPKVFFLASFQVRLILLITLVIIFIFLFSTNKKALECTLLLWMKVLWMKCCALLLI